MSRPEIGFSFNNLGDFPFYREVLGELHLEPPLPFVEILWDNYCHLDPHELRDVLAPLTSRVSLHIMMSKFLECSEEELERFLCRLEEHVRVLDPVRVSDHVARFRVGAVRTSLPLDYDYGAAAPAAERVARYQDRIGRQLLLENFASTEAVGARQIEFFTELVQRTGCGVLFDVSNAVVAELNGILPASAWLETLRGASLHCHIGGYRLGASGDLYHDTHDRSISGESELLLRELLLCADVRSLCYERDYGKSVAAFCRDVSLIRQLAEGPPPALEVPA